MRVAFINTGLIRPILWSGCKDMEGMEKKKQETGNNENNSVFFTLNSKKLFT